MQTASQHELAANLVRDFATQKPIRAGSFVITVFGDCIVPRGGRVSLASLLALLRCFGVNDSLVRTAVSRLTSEFWLKGEKRGRRSFYGLAEAGRRNFQEATRRIYEGPMPEWDGRWHVLLLAGAAGEDRDRLRKELRWLGFGQFAANVALHPSADDAMVADLIARHQAGDTTAVVAGSSQLLGAPGAVARIVASSWNLEVLAEAYRAFLVQFRPLADTLARDVELSPLEAMQVRLLLVHAFRKIVLQDPMLPLSLLPADWVGTEARGLCREIYRQVVRPAEAWADANLAREDGPLPAPESAFWSRFGGLGRPLPTESHANI